MTHIFISEVKLHRQKFKNFSSFELNSIIELFQKPNHEITTIGNRHGEKLHEVLLNKEEMSSAFDLGNYYKIPPDLREMNYGKYFDKGDINLSKAREYSSENTEQLTVDSLKKLLLKVPYVNKLIEIRSKH